MNGHTVNKSRRHFLLTATAGMVVLGSGCSMTQQLFADRIYEEQVSSILISADGKKLVFIGQDYHYIFDAPDVIVRTLRASYHKDITAELRNFHVRANGEVSGLVQLKLDNKAPEADTAAARLDGYTTASTGDLQNEVKLQGIRYRSGGIAPNGAASALNKTYTVSVSEEQTAGQKAARSLLTPVTVTADGLLMLVTVPLFAITFAMLKS